MCNEEPNSIETLIRASDLLPEAQRQRLLGIAEGVAIAVSTQNNTEKK